MKKNLLRAEMALVGMSDVALAKAINMNPKTFSNKLNGKTCFNADEIVRICRIIPISDPQKKVDIFLT